MTAVEKAQKLKELIGEIDVEKKVNDYVEELINCNSVKESERTWISAICYNFIQSLQPKTEWDVEIEMEDSFIKNDEVYVDENNAKGNYYTHSKKPKLDAKGLILKLKSE